MTGDQSLSGVRPSGRGMAPGGVEPPHTDSKSVALSAELRGPSAGYRRKNESFPHPNAAEANSARLRRYGHTEKNPPKVMRRRARLSAAEVADGTRTHDHLDHNQGLYQLSYRHRGRAQDSGVFARSSRSSSTDS
jgi:hypothetical protein